MDGWWKTDEWMGERMGEEKMNRRFNWEKNGWMNWSMDGWMERWVNRWMDGCMNRKMGRWMEERMDKGKMNRRLNDRLMEGWIRICMDIWGNVWKMNVWKDGEIDGCIHLSELLFSSKTGKRAINSINRAGTATATIRRENRRWIGKRNLCPGLIPVSLSYSSCRYFWYDGRQRGVAERTQDLKIKRIVFEQPSHLVWLWLWSPSTPLRFSKLDSLST